jgi:ribonuclease J
MAKILERIQKPKAELKVIEEYVDYPTLLKKTSLEDIEEESLILTPYREVIDLLRELHSKGSLKGETVAVLSEPEPEREEHIEYGAFANWFAKLGIQNYRIRASGHYYPYQLKEIIEAIKPKEIRPIHTLRPELLLRMAMAEDDLEEKAIKKIEEMIKRVRKRLEV